MRYSKTIAFFIYSFLFISCFSFLHTANIFHATGTILYVGGSGLGNYTTIQAAVTDAAGGDTIYVYQNTLYHSTYSENVVINKNLNLIGEDKDTTIIDGGKSGHVIRVADSSGDIIECSISGFTLRNAGGTGNSCISMSNSHNSNIGNNKILNSNLNDGIFLDHCSDITIQENTIANNVNGSGIYLFYSSSNIIHNNIIQLNSRGVYLVESSSNVIYDNDITRNNFGISVPSSSSNNFFYLNDFTNNNNANAQDSGTNTWSYNSQGNYWGDYTGADADHDGIGDTSYTKNGVTDSFPLGYFQTGNQKPIATILSVAPITALFGTTISFSGMGADPDPTGYIIGYRWISSINGQISSAASFSTLSLSLGTHEISFEVKDNADAWSDKAFVTVTINEPNNQKPVAIIVSINPTQTSFGSLVYFYGYGNDEGTIIAYKWTSSIDGVFGTQQSFNRSNLSVGNHLISFQVMDSQGLWSDEDARSLVVVSTSSALNLPPVAIAGGPYSAVVNISLSFDASQSHDQDPQGSIVSYVWNFGDDTTANGVQVEHIYAASGNYTVTLQVTDNNGTKTTATTQASVYKPGEQPNNGGSNGNGHTETPDNGISFDIPWMIVVPVAGVLIFVGIIIGFFSWMKRS